MISSHSQKHKSDPYLGSSNMRIAPKAVVRHSLAENVNFDRKITEHLMTSSFIWEVLG